MKLYAWLVGAWIAVLWFFIFGIARTLFSAFPRARAGEVTTALFPTYFTVSIALGLLATFVLWANHRRVRRCRWALSLQMLALIALAAIPIFVQPLIAAHAPGSEGFAMWHGVSMGMNLFSLLAVPAASLLVLARRKD